MSGWWYRASTEQRLAQIDGCLELGMTSRQCAMNVGCYDEQREYSTGNKAVIQFAAAHGRRFPVTNPGRRANNGFITVNGEVLTRRAAHIRASKEAYLSGEPVDFWSAQ